MHWPKELLLTNFFWVIASHCVSTLCLWLVACLLTPTRFAVVAEMHISPTTPTISLGIKLVCGSIFFISSTTYTITSTSATTGAAGFCCQLLDGCHGILKLVGEGWIRLHELWIRCGERVNDVTVGCGRNCHIIQGRADGDHGIGHMESRMFYHDLLLFLDIVICVGKECI